LDNVEVQANHAIVRGELATYTVHLGSALSGVLPGASLYIVAVHSQHRGRLFLPFADDDPRTAEVLSKVLLLARDREIKDPSIPEQIRSATRSAGRASAVTSAASLPHDHHRDRPVPRARIQVDQHDLLPRAQRDAAVDDGQRERRPDEKRADVAVA